MPLNNKNPKRQLLMPARIRIRVSHHGCLAPWQDGVDALGLGNAPVCLGILGDLERLKGIVRLKEAESHDSSQFNRTI